MVSRRTLLGILTLLVPGAGLSRAEDDVDTDDHDEARRAVERGRARPLAEILKQVQSRLEGKVIGVEFERERDRYVYEFKIVMSDGRLREIYVDAMTGEMLKSEEE